MKRNRVRGLRRIDPFWAVVAVVVIAFVAVIGIIAQEVTSPTGYRSRVHRAEVQCHQRGPGYHYWDERGQCVLYIQSGP